MKQKTSSIQGFNTALENEFILEERASLSKPVFNQLSNILDWTGREILAASWIPVVKLNKQTEPDLSNLHAEDNSDAVLDHHFPVKFSRVDVPLDMLEGVDLAAIPEYETAFIRSMVDDSVVTINHAGEYDDGRPAFSILYPVFKRHKASAVQLDEHVGFLGVDIDMKEVLENALAPYPPQGLHVRMWNKHVSDVSPDFIYTHISRTVDKLEPIDSPIFKEQDFKFYDRDLTLRFDASSTFMKTHSYNLKWALLGVSLLLTFIVSMTFLYVFKQKKVRRTYKKLSTAVEQSGQAITITDNNGVIEYVNPAYSVITGYEREDVLGQNTRLFASGKQSKAFYEDMWQTILAGKTWQAPITERRKDGSFYPSILTISPILSSEGKVVNFVAVHDDLSLQKDMEDQLHQSQKLEAVGTLVGGVAHNFNNLLAAIVGKAYLGSLQLEKNPVKAGEYLESIKALSQQAANMISQLLVFSRGSNVECESVPFNTLMEETAKTACLGVPENIDVDMKITDEPLRVFGNSVELQQVIMNLINNARDAVSGMEHGRLRIRLQSQAGNTCCNQANCIVCSSNDSATLIVEDTGSGMSEEEMVHIFEPFYTTKAPHKGTGLGLSTLYGTVEAHGGVVHVESEVGEGTIFSICLPIVNGLVEESENQEGLEVMRARAHACVLVIDDDEMVRLTLENILCSFDYTVFTAVDGLDGVETFKKHSDDIALVISDIVMPKMNGYATIAVIRELVPYIPVLYITGYDEGESLSKIQLNENTKLVGKPFHIEKLSHLVHELIGK
ncbi:MAG: ATP-binding protein [Ghiorsea sp.]